MKKQEFDDLEDRVISLETKNTIKEEKEKWLKTICITATGTSLTFLVWLGGKIYDKWEAFGAAIRAFIEAGKHGQ